MHIRYKKAICVLFFPFFIRSFPSHREMEVTSSAFRKISAQSLHVSKPTHWLTSRFHFSFADYYNPYNLNFGVLRVLNDDLVLPKNGFGMHPHRDQEIFSYIVNGELSHEDNQGNQETLGRGAVQFMSAGRGVWHSEMNNHPKDTVRFLQIWISPNQKGLPVKYGSHHFNFEQRHNQLLPIIKGEGSSSADSPAPITLSQDCNVYVSEMDRNVCVTKEIFSGRQAYMVLIEGGVQVEGDMHTGSSGNQSSSGCSSSNTTLSMRDALEVMGPVNLRVTSTSDSSHFLLIEMASP
mmetsp:Transcript_19657/g.19753  ORF Transcript_19657/g.19753 Transcript_19657/m.19753 type:complete len:293 (+) Transcript_19657:54-932(+)